MATIHFNSVNYQQAGNNSQCMDPTDMDSWVDFGSPVQGHASNGKMAIKPAQMVITSPTNSLLPLDSDDQTPVAPSHDYSRYKQQTGLPLNVNLRNVSQDQVVFSNFNSGLDDFALGDANGFGSMTGDMGLDSGMSAYFYPTDAQNDNFVDPPAMHNQEEAATNMRYYPGVHQQNALRAQQAAQAQQQQLLAQQQKQREATERQRRASHQSIDAHAEETISRVVNQIRKNSMMPASLSPDDSGLLPQSLRFKKDEDDMDEDERLLNSEEGKKLSSKERRQLRNKVSARAFRSRRKEYIGQLEGEVAIKVNECNELKMQNRALMEENARYRSLAEKLLNHGAFRPFLEELSRDPALAASISGVVNGSSASQAPQQQQQQQARKDMDPYAQQQQFLSSQNQQNQHVGMTLVPDTHINFSSLNLGGNNWNTGSMNFTQSQVFAVLEVPEEPVDVSVLCGKYSNEEPEGPSFETCKYDTPAEIETSEASSKHAPAYEPMDAECLVASNPPAEFFDEQDPAFTLYADSRPTSNKATQAEAMYLLSRLPSEKPSQYEVTSDAEEIELPATVEKRCAQLNAACKRIDAIIASFRL